MLIATHNIIVHEKRRKRTCKHIELYVCALKFNTVQDVLLKISKIWRFRFPPPSLNYLTRDRPESLRWLDHGSILVGLK